MDSQEPLKPLPTTEKELLATVDIRDVLHAINNEAPERATLLIRGIKKLQEEISQLRSERDEARKNTELARSNEASLRRDLVKVEAQTESQSALIEKLKEGMGIYREALVKVSTVSIWDFREFGQIVSSEHYEAAWLKCLEIASEALSSARKVGM